MSEIGGDPDQYAPGNQPDGSYYNPFPSPQPGLFGGMYADAQPNAPAGMSNVDAAALGLDDTGLPFSVMAPDLPQSPGASSDDSAGSSTPPPDPANGASAADNNRFICQKSDGTRYYSNGAGLGAGTGQALARGDAPTNDKFRAGLGGGGPSGKATSPLSSNLRNAFGNSKFRPLEHGTDTTSVGGSLARGLGLLGVLGSLLDFYAMTTDPDVCVPDES